MPATKVKSQWSAGNLQFLADDGTVLAEFDGTGEQLIVPGMVRSVRHRFTAAEVNAGATIVAAIDGYQFRLVDASLIAIGGNAATATSVDILATQSASSVKLVAAAVAGLTQNALLRAGASNAAILAAGASFVLNDENTAITISKTGSNLATATHIDVLLTYAVEAAAA